MTEHRIRRSIITTDDLIGNVRQLVECSCHAYWELPKLEVRVGGNPAVKAFWAGVELGERFARHQMEELVREVHRQEEPLSTGQSKTGQSPQGASAEKEGQTISPSITAQHTRDAAGP